MKMLLAPALAAAATLAGCAATGTGPATPTPPAEAYMALGTEPGWTLEITPARLAYNGDYGETPIAVVATTSFCSAWAWACRRSAASRAAFASSR